MGAGGRVLSRGACIEPPARAPGGGALPRWICGKFPGSCPPPQDGCAGFLLLLPSCLVSFPAPWRSEISYYFNFSPIASQPLEICLHLRWLLLENLALTPLE